MSERDRLLLALLSEMADQIGKLDSLVRHQERDSFHREMDRASIYNNLQALDAQIKAVLP
jgi:hypothetical protein